MTARNKKTITAMGADLRALRRARGLTLAELSQQLGRSVGWLSQVERDMSRADPVDLAQLAKHLDINVDSLAPLRSTPKETGKIVRATDRRPIGSRQPGLTEALLSPDLTDSFEVIHSSFAPQSRLQGDVQRDTQEIGFVIRGSLDIWINDDRFRLREGDSFRLRGETFRWHNPHDDACDVVWVISPPIY